jgi:riboflavin kinase / FMN adenylyltransferase
LNIYKSISDIKIQNPVATIGIFDGVHIAHKKIFKRLTDTAGIKNGKSLIVTLWPHPRTFFHSDSEPIKFITTLEEKIELIEKTGIDNLLILPFNKEMAETSFEDFVSKILVNGLGICHLIVGFNHHFGKNREGNFEKLESLSKKYKFGLEQLKPVILNSENVSSSVIRNFILSGDIGNANKFLGYLFSLTGKVVEGNKIGRKIGFPTANIQLIDSHKIIPGNGVYAVEVKLDNNLKIKGMMNIGYRPTLSEEKPEKTIEVHMIDHNEDLYNKIITISFIDRIRDEKKFNNIEELKTQLENDRNVIRNILS